jgi:fumarate reductase iron-sulfur subunit
MEPRTVNVTVTRCDPSQSSTVVDQTFRVPLDEGMTVLQALDYIYEHLDPTLAYYDHGVCAQGICKRCLLLVNGEVQLACRHRVSGDVRVAPLPRFRIVRDLVYERERGIRERDGDAGCGCDPGRRAR